MKVAKLQLIILFIIIIYLPVKISSKAAQSFSSGSSRYQQTYSQHYHMKFCFITRFERIIFKRGELFFGTVGITYL